MLSGFVEFINSITEIDFSNEEQIDLARAIPNSDLVLYGNLCHSPNWEDPERLTADLLQFLRTQVFR